VLSPRKLVGVSDAERCRRQSGEPALYTRRHAEQRPSIGYPAGTIRVSSTEAVVDPSIHRLPHSRVSDRVAFLLDLARGKRVIDLGFVDEGRMSTKLDKGVWLHADLKRVARELVGIDFNADGVAVAKELGYESHHADCQSYESIHGLKLEPADVVIAGELLEHLDQPGPFLDAIKQLVTPGGILVITTPNGLSLTNFVASLLGRELVNPDHVSWQSVRTCTTLLRRRGWDVRGVSFYRFPSVRESAVAGTVTAGQIALFTTYQVLARPLFLFRPWLADGLILIAELRHAAPRVGDA
jgi:2-polyprenyl-3-methyl-5-hydroxy-6-metoxy-1,4-benzoquinol methylase